MLYEVKVVCCFCSHEFWAAVETDTPMTPGRLFEVRCPSNTSRVRFRISEGRTSTWDATYIYQTTEWRQAERLPPGHPVARAVEE